MANISIEDRIAIQELTHRYGFYCDTANLDAVMDLFADDASFDETMLGLTVSHGKEALRAYYKHGIDSLHMAHYVTNHMIDSFDGDRAAGKCFIHAECRQKDSGEPVRIYGYYDDAYWKVDGRWIFQSRKVVPFFPPEMGSHSV